MRFEDLGLVNTFAFLHHQEPVWLLPVVCFSTDCAPPSVTPFSPGNPPNVVYQRETVTTRAQERHGHASLSSRWLNDASQVFCASDHDFLNDAQLPCLILRHLLEGFLYSVKSPFRGFYFSSENAFVFFLVSTFQDDKALLHHSVRAVSVVAAFTLLQVLFGWRFQLPLTLHSCLFFFFRLLSEPLYSFSFLAKVFPRIVLFHHFPKTSTVRLLPRELSPLPICPCFYTLCLQRIVVTFVA